MLGEEPTGSTTRALATWHKIGALTIEKLQELTPEYASINFDEAKYEFKEWTDKQGNRWKGQVSKGGKRQNGIVREITLGGWIYERQQKDGKEHGFVRVILPNGDYVTSFYKDGKHHGAYAHYKSNGKLVT